MLTNEFSLWRSLEQTVSSRIYCPHKETPNTVSDPVPTHKSCHTSILATLYHIYVFCTSIYTVKGWHSFGDFFVVINSFCLSFLIVKTIISHDLSCIPQCVCVTGSVCHIPPLSYLLFLFWAFMMTKLWYVSAFAHGKTLAFLILFLYLCLIFM